MKRKWILIAAMVIAVSMVFSLSLAGCKTTTTETTAAATTAAEVTTAAETTAAATTAAVQNTEEKMERKVIGLSVPSASWPWMSKIVDGYKEAAKKYDFDVVVVSADGDTMKQNNDIDDLIVKNVDVIATCPMDPTSLLPQTKKAYEKGIGVLFFGNPPADELLDYAIGYNGFDSWANAVMAADLIAKALNNEGKIVMLQGFPGQPSEVAKTEGFESELKKVAPNMEIVDRQPYDWDAAKAQVVAEDFLAKYPDIDGMYVQDDNAGASVVEIVKQHGYKKGEIIICCPGDGFENALQTVKEGWMYGTLILFASMTANANIETINMYFKGEEIPKSLIISGEICTIENVDEWIGKDK